MIEDRQCVFEKSIDHLIYIILFGSCAKGNIDINSDINLLVDYKVTNR